MKTFLIAAAIVLLAGTVAKADSLSVGASMGDQSVVSYGLSLEKDWSLAYASLENDIAGNASSNLTTLASGVHFSIVNLGIYAGDKFVTGNVLGTAGVEGGLSIPLGDSPLFLKENTRIGRYTGSPNTDASLGVGLGLRF